MGTNIPTPEQLRRLFPFFLPLGDSLPLSPWRFLLASKTQCNVTLMLNGVIFRNSLLKIGDKEFDNKRVILYLDVKIHFT